MQRCYFDLEYAIENTTRELALTDTIRSITDPTVGSYNSNYIIVEYVHLINKAAIDRTNYSYTNWNILVNSSSSRNRIVIIQTNFHNTTKEYQNAFSTICFRRLITLSEADTYLTTPINTIGRKIIHPQHPNPYNSKTFVGYKILNKQLNKHNSLPDYQQTSNPRESNSISKKTFDNVRIRLVEESQKTPHNSYTRVSGILSQIHKLRLFKRVLKSSELISGTSDAFSRAWNTNSLMLKSKIRLTTTDNQKTEFQIGAKIGDIDDSSYWSSGTEYLNEQYLFDTKVFNQDYVMYGYSEIDESVKNHQRNKTRLA